MSCCRWGATIAVDAVLLAAAAAAAASLAIVIAVAVAVLTIARASDDNYCQLHRVLLVACVCLRVCVFMRVCVSAFMFWICVLVVFFLFWESQARARYVRTRATQNEN